MNPKYAKILVVGFTIFALLTFADYFYAHQAISLIKALGFALLAYGLHRSSERPGDRIGLYATLLGLAIGIGTLVTRFMP